MNKIKTTLGIGKGIAAGEGLKNKKFMFAYEHCSRNANKVALTFDDGPNPFFTVKILDMLDKYSVKANFFILGQNAAVYPDIVKEVFGRGHLIGNHSYSHPKDGAIDFQEAEDIIFKIIGQNTKFIRPPYLDNARCADYEPVKTGKIKIINADVFPNENWPKAEVRKFVINKTQNGSIILLHDGSRKDFEQKIRPEEMFKALPSIIENIILRFQIVLLNEMDFGN